MKPDEIETDEETPEIDPGEFQVVLIDESQPTIDGRIFEPGKVTWREPPMPLMFMVHNGDNGHKGSEVGGVITEVWRDGDKVLGKGRFASNDKGQELRSLIQEEVLTGISSDVGGAIVEEELAEDGTAQTRIVQGRIMGATVLPFQAFDETRIAVTASAVPASPPKAWFENPQLAGPTPLTITKEGQVFGHAALWESCHIGRPGTCLTPPRSRSDYAYYKTGAVLTAEGDEVHVGPITLGTGHAALTLNGQKAAEHYDNTGTAVADVTTGEDMHGLWMAGAVRPGVPDEKLHELRAAAISGDWRGVNGGHELVALLAVNTPGFPVPRTRAAFSADNDSEPLALVASGIVDDAELHPESITDEVLQELAAEIEIIEVSEPEPEGLSAAERIELGNRLDGIEAAALALAMSRLDVA